MLDQIPWRFQPKQHQEVNYYCHQCLEMLHWHQFSRQYVMFKSYSICFISFSSKWRQSPWLLWHAILADLQSFLSSCISLLDVAEEGHTCIEAEQIFNICYWRKEGSDCKILLNIMYYYEYSTLKFKIWTMIIWVKQF